MDVVTCIWKNGIIENNRIFPLDVAAQNIVMVDKRAAHWIEHLKKALISCLW